MPTRPINPELLEAVKQQAPALGLTPKELLGIYSYETGGTLDPWQRGPTTKWGTHRGLIQWGEPQARKYGVNADMPVDQQVAASLKYLQDRGFKPGMGLAQAYAAVNAGGVSPKHLQARDAAAGGAPGTVLDKVNKQMGPHLAKAEKLLGTMVANSAEQSPPQRRPDGAPGPRDAPSAPANPQQGTLASIYEPFQKLATEQKEQQVEQQLATAQALLTERPQVDQPPPAPPAPPAALSPDFASLMFPRIRRGLLGGDGYGLLG